MYETREPFQFYLFKKNVYFLLTKDFCTLNDYPASKISDVIIYKLSLTTEQSCKEICEVKTENKTVMNKRYT